MGDDLLTVSEAARLVGDRTPDCYRKAANRGLLKVALRTQSGLRLFRRAEILRYHQRHGRKAHRPAQK
jgi:hypothetical protein